MNISTLTFKKDDKVKLPFALHEGVYVCGDIAPLILNMGARWRRMISFMSWTHYTGEGSTLYLLNKRLGVPQGEMDPLQQTESLAPTGIRTPDPLACSLDAISTNLGWLFKRISYFPPLRRHK